MWLLGSPPAVAWPVCATPELKDRLSQEEWHRLSGHLTAGSDLGLSGHSAVGSAWWGLSGCLSGHWAVGSDRSGRSGGLSGHLAVGSDQLCLWRLLWGRARTWAFRDTSLRALTVSFRHRWLRGCRCHSLLRDLTGSFRDDGFGNPLLLAALLCGVGDSFRCKDTWSAGRDNIRRCWLRRCWLHLGSPVTRIGHRLQVPSCSILVEAQEGIVCPAQYHH